MFFPATACKFSCVGSFADDLLARLGKTSVTVCAVSIAGEQDEDIARHDNAFCVIFQSDETA